MRIRLRRSTAGKYAVKESIMHKSRVWMFFVALAGLCWGVYVPLIAEGGKDLHNPFAAFLCVGAAYFLLAVLLPDPHPAVRGKKAGLERPRHQPSSTLAGVAGAVGALCVIFATVVFQRAAALTSPRSIFALAPGHQHHRQPLLAPRRGAVHGRRPARAGPLVALPRRRPGRPRRRPGAVTPRRLPDILAGTKTVAVQRLHLRDLRAAGRPQLGASTSR